MPLLVMAFIFIAAISNFDAKRMPSKVSILKKGIGYSIMSTFISFIYKKAPNLETFKISVVGNNLLISFESILFSSILAVGLYLKMSKSTDILCSYLKAKLVPPTKQYVESISKDINSLSNSL